MSAVRVELPQHLRKLAGIAGHEVVLDTVGTQQRRAFLRFFACEEDISLLALDAPLPEAVANGSEPLLIIAGVAGG